MGTYFCNYDLDQNSISFNHAHAQCMSELCSKFKFPALNTVEGVAETRTALQCDMVKTYVI